MLGFGDPKTEKQDLAFEEGGGFFWGDGFFHGVVFGVWVDGVR